MAQAAMVFSLVAGLAGSAVEAVGNVQQLEAQAQAADYNAEVAKQNAILSKQQAQEDARRLEIDGRKTQGTIRANLGASGITLEGSAMDVLEESAANIELDRLSVLYQGEVKAHSYSAQAELDRFAARTARSQKFFGAAAPILKGIARAGSLGAGLA